MVPPARSFLNGTTGATPSRTEAVLDAIKRAILAGELRPGQSLVETELAQMLGVSKTPVREALKTLAGAGLVTMSPYRGAAVRTIDPASAAGIYDLRLLLEPEAVRRGVGGRAAEASPARASSGDAHPALQAADAATDQAQRSRKPRVSSRPAWPAATACSSRPWTTCAIRPR
jgi:DNA-binding GntR family transcriptional regulator